MRSPLHWAGTAALGVAVILLFTLQFLPWTKHEDTVVVPAQQIPGMPGGGFPEQRFHIELRGYTWSVQAEANGQDERESWYSDDVEGGGTDGLGAIRTSIPLLLVGLVLVGGALVLQVLRFGNAAGLAAAVGALLVLVGTVLMAVGQDAFFDGIDPTWHAGLYLAILAILAAVAGSVLVFLPPDEEGGASPVRPVDFD